MPKISLLPDGTALTLTGAELFPFVQSGTTYRGTINQIGAKFGLGGLGTYAIGDLLYASTTTQLARLAAVAVGSVLASAGVSTAPAWSSSPYISSSLRVGPSASTSNGVFQVQPTAKSDFYVGYTSDPVQALVRMQHGKLPSDLIVLTGGATGLAYQSLVDTSASGFSYSGMALDIQSQAGTSGGVVGINVVATAGGTWIPGGGVLPGVTGISAAGVSTRGGHIWGIDVTGIARTTAATELNAIEINLQNEIAGTATASGIWLVDNSTVAPTSGVAIRIGAQGAGRWPTSLIHLTTSAGFFPLGASAALFSSDTGTIDHGFDFSKITMTSNYWVLTLNNNSILSYNAAGLATKSLLKLDASDKVSLYDGIALLTAAGNFQLGASGTLGSVTMGNATSGLLTLQPVTGALGTVTVSIPAATDTLVNLASSQELTNKTLTSSVGKGTWTASGTWTLPAITLGGTVSGGGNQLNNIIIGTTTPLAGSFTTVSGSTSVTSPLDIGGSGTTGIQKTFKTTTGNGTTDAFSFAGGNNGATVFGGLSVTGLAIQAPTGSPVLSGTNQQTVISQLYGSLHVGGIAGATGVNDDGLLQVGGYGYLSGENWGATTLLGSNLACQNRSSASTIYTPTSQGAIGYQGVHFFAGADIKFYNFLGATTAGQAVTPTTRLSIATDGGIYTGAATGTTKGAGTLNLDNALYKDGTQVVSDRVTGYTAFTGTNTNRATAYDTATITLVQLAERVRALQVDLTAHGLIGA